MLDSIVVGSIRRHRTDRRRAALRRLRPLLAIAALAPAVVYPQTQQDRRVESSRPQKQLTATQTTPATPPAPDWPINDQPKPAAVTWTKDQLSIDAANSSLQQILTNVASATGTSVDGLTKDERIFGTFGPAPARDVLSQLLQGTGYNILMVGDQGQGVPRQVILSARNNSKTTQGATRTTSADNDDDFVPEVQYDPPLPPQPQPQQPMMPLRPGFNPGVNPQQPGQPMQQPGQPEPGQQPANPPNQQ